MFDQGMVGRVLSSARLALRRVSLVVALNVVAIFALAAPAHAQSATVHSARIVNDHVELVVSTDVTHSCFLLKNSFGALRGLYSLCLTPGNQQIFSAPLDWFPELRINDTLYLQTAIAPQIFSQNFQFSGDLALHSVRIVGGTQVEVTYTKSFPGCTLMKNQSGTVISRVSSTLCDVGANITTLLDRDLNFSSIQPGQQVSLGVITRNDLNTNTVTVNSSASTLPCVLSNTSISMLDRATIVANQIYAEDMLTMGADSAITGSVLGRDDGKMDYRSRINGNLSLIGTLLLERGTVTGQLRENTPVTQQAVVASFVSDSTPNYTVSWDQALTLPPGRYGNVVVMDRGRLRLDGAGAYSFANLSFASDSKLELSTLQGEFNIETDDSLVFGDRFVMQAPNGGLVDGSRIFFYTNAPTLIVPYDVVLRGQLWAPNANVTVRDRAVVHGCLRARQIGLSYDARLFQN
jgi:hypothetical protein